VGEVEGLRVVVGVAGDGVGEGAGEFVAEFAEGDAEAVDNLLGFCVRDLFGDGEGEGGGGKGRRKGKEVAVRWNKSTKTTPPL